LWIGHFAFGLYGHDSWSKLRPHQSLLEFSFGLAWTEEEQVLEIAKCRDHGVVVDIEFARQRPLAIVIGWNLACFVGAF
jgi:hypothetical protein